jgi:hypothetical protein
MIKGNECSILYNSQWFTDGLAFGNNTFVLRDYVLTKSGDGSLEMRYFDAFPNPPYTGIAMVCAELLSNGINPNDGNVDFTEYKICAKCGKQGDGVYYEVEYHGYMVLVCHDHISQCPDCGKISFLHSGRSRNCLCQVCQRQYRRCFCCGEDRKESEGVSYNERFVCKSCLNRGDVAYCPECGRLVYSCDIEDGICQRCIDGMMHEHDYVPDGGYKKHGKGEVFYGIELETDNYNGIRKAIRGLLLLSNEEEDYFMMEDGSLGNGIEITFNPRSLSSWKKYERKLVDITNIVLENGGRSYDADSCGLHIHRSKTDLSEIDILKIITFLVRFKNENCKIAQRCSNYASFYYTEDIKENGNLKFIYKNKNNLSYEKYVVLNLQHSDSIEFRMFKGTLKIDTIYSYLEFCDAVVSFVKTCSLVFLINGDEKKVWKKFANYVCENKYNSLKEYLKRKELLCV